MKTLQKNPVESAKALKIELAAIDRYRAAYVMRSAMKLLFAAAGAVLVWKFKQGTW